MNIKTESQKDQEQLEREIDEQRAHIGDTISALEAQFSPGQMLDKVLSYGRANGGEFTRNLVNTVKNNPVPTIMTAVGIAWMMYGQNRSGFAYGYGTSANASYGLDSDYEHSRSKAGELKDKAVHLKDTIKGGVSNARHRAGETSAHWRESAAHAGQQIRAGAHQASDGFNSLLHEQPLAVGAIGLAVGALIAACLPATRAEDRYLGETRDKVADKARDFTKEGARKVSEVGQQVRRDAQEQIRTSGDSGSTRAPYPGYADTSTRSDNSPKLNS